MRYAARLGLLNAMMPRVCPYLPAIERLTTARDIEAKRDVPRETFQFHLETAQSYLLCAKPAQALLQLTKAIALGCAQSDLWEEGDSLYQAKVWMLKTPPSGTSFLGNPVRHYQHLASRMSGPNSEARSLRAWFCFHLAETVLPDAPRDERQIEREKLVIPDGEFVFTQLQDEAGEVELQSLLAAKDLAEL